MSARRLNDEVNKSRRRGNRDSSGSGADSSNSAISGRAAAVVNMPAKPTRIKIVSMGDMAVGKSCIIKRYCEERFVQKYISTIGIDYGVKPHNLKGTDVRINFWDMSGNPGKAVF
jgi:GTPase SAR1 family protein